MKHPMLCFTLMILTLQAAGCGGGGSGGATVSHPPVSAALVKLSTLNPTPGPALIGDIDVTLNLPAGVTLKSVASLNNPGQLEPAPGVLVLKGEPPPARTACSRRSTYPAPRPS